MLSVRHYAKRSIIFFNPHNGLMIGININTALLQARNLILREVKNCLKTHEQLVSELRFERELAWITKCGLLTILLFELPIC